MSRILRGNLSLSGSAGATRRTSCRGGTGKEGIYTCMRKESNKCGVKCGHDPSKPTVQGAQRLLLLLTV